MGSSRIQDGDSYQTAGRYLPCGQLVPRLRFRPRQKGKACRAVCMWRGSHAAPQCGPESSGLFRCRSKFESRGGEARAASAEPRAA
eukprot:9624119-Karenia_brevis.AAC.1